MANATPTTSIHTRAPADAAEQLHRIEELGRIIAAYNQITDRLQQSHDQLTRTVQSLQQELGEKNRLLERKTRLAALGEMAAGMAHEIRNPLGGIQLYASLLARDLGDRPDALLVVGKISTGVKRLESIVGQVLQFSREIHADPAPADLSEIVAQSVEYASQALAIRDAACEAAGPREMNVRVDAGLLQQAVLNLLLNAAEAADSAQEHSARTGGRVSINFGPPPVGSAAKQFHLVVQDNGPGVPAAVMDRIFNPFFTTKDSGTGLGLSIVHRIVEAHDGTISVTNPPGGGARFEIRI